MDVDPTPKGELVRYLIGDLAPARRHLNRLLKQEIKPSHQIYVEIGQSIARCEARFLRDVPLLLNQTK